MQDRDPPEALDGAKHAMRVTAPWRQGKTSPSRISCHMRAEHHRRATQPGRRAGEPCLETASMGNRPARAPPASGQACRVELLMAGPRAALDGGRCKAVE